MRLAGKAIHHIAAAGLTVVALLWILTFWGTPYDDAYIYFRYARNLAAGHGAVFNVGERVEGYTGFAWLLLQTLGALLGASPALFAAILSLCAYAAIGWLLFSEGSLRYGPSVLALLPAALYVCYPANAMWALSGLETTFHALLILAAVVCYRRRRLALTGGVLLVAALNRVEGIALYAVFLGYEAFALLRARNWNRRSLVLAWGIPAYGIYLLCRHAYYGDWLPNTYYAKVGTGSAVFQRGFDYSHDFIDSAFGCALFFALAIVHGLIHSRRDPVWALSALLLLAGLSLAVIGGGNNLPLWRYLNPYHPLAALLIADFLAGVRGRGFTARAAAVGIGVLIFFSGITSAIADDNVVALIRNNRSFYRSSRVAGELFREALDPSQSIALNAIPFTSYYFGGTVIDMLGLVDRHIAHREIAMGTARPHGHEKGDGRYVLDRMPTLLILSGGPGIVDREDRGYPRPDQFYLLSDQEIAADPRFPALYEPYAFRVGKRFINVYRLRGGKLRAVDVEAFRTKWEPTLDERGPFEDWLSHERHWGMFLSDSWMGILNRAFRNLTSWESRG